ncbi:2-dehydropantoate 2-reductase [Luteococcus sp. H138]|uniref:2-dehydropantoate 2-reductase n=1 Tax=unclassified Luteococcus TaxID=2639923 RepID=UPI00313D5338
MRIVVVGAGALGGYFGALLQRDGHGVEYLARGEHLAALRRDGLRITGATTLTLSIAVTDDPQILAPADLVLLAVKANQLDEVLPTLSGLIGPETAVVTLQNGLEAPGVVAGVLGRDRVLPAVVRVYTRIAAPGVIEHMGGPGSITVAEWDNAETERNTRIRQALVAAGIASPPPEDIWLDLWRKVMFVVSTGLLGALADAPLGDQRTRLRPQLAAIMAEVRDVGLAAGIALDDAVEETLAFADRMPADATTSLHRDLAAGQPGELDPLVGGVCRRAREVGVATPLFDLGHALLVHRLARRERARVSSVDCAGNARSAGR